MNVRAANQSIFPIILKLLSTISIEWRAVDMNSFAALNIKNKFNLLAFNLLHTLFKLRSISRIYRNFKWTNNFWSKLANVKEAHVWVGKAYVIRMPVKQTQEIKFEKHLFQMQLYSVKYFNVNSTPECQIVSNIFYVCISTAPVLLQDSAK